MDLIAGLKSKLHLAPADEEYDDEPDAEEAEDYAEDDGYGEPEREVEDFAVPQRRASEDFRRPAGPRPGSGLVSREDVKRYIRQPGYGRMEEPMSSPYRPAFCAAVPLAPPVFFRKLLRWISQGPSASSAA